ncbi:HAD family hydrolase [Clostridium sp.]|uniref:HAD family hydrolase n=1 Tax=Clostridium sp. TaxID=1506 RepID=UPI003F370F47
MKKYILFDLDGTVTDPMVGITKSVKYALNKFNINTKTLEELCKFIGPPLKESFMEYYNFSDEEAEKAIIYYREYFSIKGIYENYVYDNFENILSSLKQEGKTLIIATTKTTIFAEQIIEHFNLSKYFDFICGSNLDGTRTKKADIIQYILDKYNIDNHSDVVMIGDRKHDIIGAKEVGIDSIGVLYGYGSYEELYNSGADYIVKDIDELSKLIIDL